MNVSTKFQAAAAVVLLAGVAGCSQTAAPTIVPVATKVPVVTVAPSSAAAPLAKGKFTSHGVAAEIDATGTGAAVTGTLTVSDSGDHATVALECSRTTEGGLIEIGGLVTESTFTDGFPKDHRVAIVFQPGTPVVAVWWVALATEASAKSCRILVEEMIRPEELTGDLEPIQGDVEFGP